MICESPDFLSYYYKTRTKEVSSQVYGTLLNNKKYITSETTGYVAGIASAYISMTVLNDMTINEDSKILLGLGSKSLGWTIVNYLTIKSIEQFENKKEHLSQKALLTSNIITFAIATSMRYGLSKIFISNGMEPEYAVTIASMTGGTLPTFLRHFMNYKNKVIKQMPLEKRL